MKLSKLRFYLLMFLACLGLVSCASSGSSKLEDGKAMELQEAKNLEDTDGDGFDEGSFIGLEENFEEGEGEFSDSVEPLDEDAGEFNEFADAEESGSEVDEFTADTEEGGSEVDEFMADAEEGESEVDEFTADAEEGGSEVDEFVDDMDDGEDPAVAQSEVVEEEESLKEPPVFPARVKLTNIEFLSNQSGGTLTISGEAPLEYQTRYNKETNQYIIEISNAFLPNNLRRPFIMKDFKSSQFGAVSAYQEKGSDQVSIIVQMKKEGASPHFKQEGGVIYVVSPSGGDGGNTLAEAEEMASDEEISLDDEGGDFEESFESQNEGAAEEYMDGEGEGESIADDGGESLNLKVLGARSLEEFLMNNNKFYGKKISLSLSDVDIRDAIEFISEESGANLVMSSQVTGKISLKLREVPWDQVLITLLRSNKLGYVRQGNVIRISTLQQLQVESQASKAILEAQKALLPLYVRVIPVSYAKVELLQAQLAPFLTAQRGKVVTDVRTSSVIVTDTETTLNRISALIKRLDIPPEQVMIEGKVVEATEAFSRNLGISWGASGVSTELGGGGGNGPLSITPSFGIRPSGAALSFNIGTLDFLGNLDAALQLAETDSTARVISSPRIVAINKEKSEISQSGEVISLSTVSQPGGGPSTTQVVRTPVTLSLSVTPQVTAAGGVIMDVDVQRQFPGAVEDLATLARAVNSRSAKTKVLVHNGETAVIGGIYDTRESKGETGVPILRSIPILGWLFKNQNYESRKNELLIFLTPRVMKKRM